jgi:hypothetical protein
VIVAIFSVKTNDEEQPLAPNLLLVVVNFQLPIRGFAFGLLQPPAVGIDKMTRVTIDASLGMSMRRVDTGDSLVIALRPFDEVQIGTACCESAWS